ncbi:autotransporter-associated beta strand repeat-containing protein [Salmonella enterica]|nr:autotransporter-associated beta strand repeat-containing protein [Salmonella enterica]
MNSYTGGTTISGGTLVASNVVLTTPSAVRAAW